LYYKQIFNTFTSQTFGLQDRVNWEWEEASYALQVMESSLAYNLYKYFAIRYYAEPDE
jgi:hypothetical protein